MASTSEVGHAKNVANFQDLIAPAPTRILSRVISKIKHPTSPHQANPLAQHTQNTTKL